MFRQARFPFLIYSLHIIIYGMNFCHCTVAQDAVADAYCSLGTAYYTEKQFAKAESAYKSALERNPEHVSTLTALSSYYFERKKYALSLPLLKKKLTYHLHDEEASIMLAHCYHAVQQYDNAIALYSKVLATNPRRIDLFMYRAQSHKRNNNYMDALNDINTYLSICTTDHQALVFKARLYQAIGKYEDALAILARASQSADILATQGHINRTIGNTAQAIKLYTQAVKKDPQKKEYLIGLSHSYMAQEQYEKGYQTLQKAILNTHTKKRLLSSEVPIQGKRIFITGEMILDDMIRNLGHVQLLKKKGASTIVQTPPALYKIIQQCDYVDMVISSSETKLPAFDYHVPITLLPLVYQKYTAREFIPYLTSSTKDRAHWNGMLPTDDTQRIGICISDQELSASPSEQRSLPAIHIAQLLTNKAHFCFIYKKGFVPQLNHISPQQLVHLCGSGFTESPEDMRALLAYIDCMDHIITIDTIIAHLAAALGKEVHLLLPHHASWKWQSHSTWGPWYPNVSTFKLNQLDKWHL